MFALSLMQIAAFQIAPATNCVVRKVAQFDRRADLPGGVISAFGAPMAEKGQPFQSGDVVNKSSPPLAIYRFVNAEQRGCELTITYEHGGRGYGVNHARLVYDNSGWRLASRLTYDER